MAYLVLLIAALLEVGGDALVRWGMHGGRLLGFALGTAALVAYSVLVNLPRWDFGRLLGIYIVVFFIISQVLAAFVFREQIPVSRIAGGALIIAGGLVITFWKA